VGGVPTPAPGGRRLAMSFSSPALREEHGDAVALLGYVLVDHAAVPGEQDVAWLVVPAELARSHPRWWASIRERADAVYRLAMGPVVQRFAAVLRAHGALDD
jgi:hypothetical protein